MGESTNEISEKIRARSLDLDQFTPIMRVGWVAKGVVYALIGIIALSIAFQGGGGGSSGEEASRTGALAQVAEASFGPVLLVLVCVGLFLYAAWRLTTALLPGDNSEVETWAHRIGWLFSAVVYGFIAWTSIGLVLDDGGGSGSGSGSGGGSRVEELSASLLESTWGRVLLGLGALGGLGVAGYFGYKGLKQKYLDEIDMSDAASWERTVLTQFGRVGWVGRSVTVGLISIFVLISVVTSDPSDAEGLDGALRDVADDWWGTLLVAAAGLGLIAYGVHAAVSARHRRLLGP